MYCSDIECQDLAIAANTVGTLRTRTEEQRQALLEALETARTLRQRAQNIDSDREESDAAALFDNEKEAAMSRPSQDNAAAIAKRQQVLYKRKTETQEATASNETKGGENMQRLLLKQHDTVQASIRRETQSHLQLTAELAELTQRLKQHSVQINASIQTQNLVSLRFH
jgi:hypothetical protein